MTDEITIIWEHADDTEKTGVSPKERELAFERFIDHYLAESLAVQNEFRDRLPFAYNSRGLARYLQVEFKRAVEDFDEAIELNPNVANFFYNRGLIKFRLKQFDSARVDLEKALHLKPDHDSAIKCIRTMEEMIAKEPDSKFCGSIL